MFITPTSRHSCSVPPAPSTPTLKDPSHHPHLKAKQHDALSHLCTVLQQHLQAPQVSQSSGSAQGGNRDPPPASGIDRPPVTLLRQKLGEQSHVVAAHGIVQGLTMLAVLIILLRLQQGEDLRNVHQTIVDSLAQNHNVTPEAGACQSPSICNGKHVRERW